MADKLYGLTAQQVQRIERVLRSVESGTMRGVPHRPFGQASRTKLGYNSYSTIAAGGSGTFDWRQSTAAGTTEVLVTANAVTAYDWFGSGSSTGDKVLLFRPEPSARWYFVKPGGGASASWGKLSVAPSTKVTAGFGSTQTDWIGINPCADAAGNSVDTATTYVVELPEVIADSMPYLTTGDVIAYFPVGNARVPISQYAKPHAHFQYTFGGFSEDFPSAKNCLMATTTAGSTSGAMSGIRSHFTIEGSGTTSVYFIAQHPGLYLLNYTVWFEIGSPTSKITAIQSYFGNSTDSVPSQVNYTQAYHSDWLFLQTTSINPPDSLNINDAKNEYATHSQAVVAELTTSHKLCVAFQTPSYYDNLRWSVSFGGHLVTPRTNSHF